MFKLSHHVPKYSPLRRNLAISTGKNTVYWKKWHSHSLSTPGDLSKGGVFLSYSNLLEWFNLGGQGHFWKYLETGSCIMSQSYNVANNISIKYLEIPKENCKTSHHLSFIKQLTPSWVMSLLKWKWYARGTLGKKIERDKWSEIVASCGKYVKEARGNLSETKMMFTKCAFSVTIVGIITVCHVILRHWKKTKPPELTERLVQSWK